jgi:signal recognition particle receptor subunit beta
MKIEAQSVTLKIVYCGPGRAGKTTNLQSLHRRAPQDEVGGLEVVTTEGDRTIFCDYLPIDLPSIGALQVRLAVYTVPGQPKYAQTRKLVLQQVDGIVFVADSSPDAGDANRASWEDLQQHMLDNHASLAATPVVIQVNKRDVRQARPVDAVVADLGVQSLPVQCAVADRDEGTVETLRVLGELCIASMQQTLLGSLMRPATPAAGSSSGMSRPPTTALVRRAQASAARPVPLRDAGVVATRLDAAPAETPPHGTASLQEVAPVASRWQSFQELRVHPVAFLAAMLHGLQEVPRPLLLVLGGAVGVIVLVTLLLMVRLA